jgi:hypothetical protein
VLFLAIVSLTACAKQSAADSTPDSTRVILIKGGV